MRRSLFLIHSASLLVPARLRGEWSREWLAELHFLNSRSVGDDRLIAFARGAFTDALWHGRNVWDREAFAHQAQSAEFCLAALLTAIVLIGAVSGFSMTRSVLMPLPYRDAAQIATVSQRGVALTTRAAVPAVFVRLWQSDSQSIEGAASYLWRQETVQIGSARAKPVVTARVSENFFPLLGVRGGVKESPVKDCEGCVALSYDFWQRELRGRPVTSGTSLVLGGNRYRVAAVLDKGFWFMSRQIAIWQVVPLSSLAGRGAGAVVRLRPGVTSAEAERDLSATLQKAGLNPWDTLIQVSPLPSRVHAVFGSFGLALALGIVTAMASSRLHFPKWNPRGALFFLAKTALLLGVVLLAGLEFTRAPFITMLGGTDLVTEPLSVWLFLLGCTGVLLWSVRDQRARCRVCLRRLGLPTRVGCPGCLLLDWAGTELVCVEGHGMLHVPEMVSCWHEPEQWTSLDDSWQGLFERS